MSILKRLRGCGECGGSSPMRCSICFATYWKDRGRSMGSMWIPRGYFIPREERVYGR